MKFCQNCGAEIDENAVVCTNCGCAIAPEKKEPTPATDGLAIAIKIFLIIGCIAQGWMILPLAWCLPITIMTFKKFKSGEKIGTGLKVCALLLVNTIAGILMLCRPDAE